MAHKSVNNANSTCSVCLNCSGTVHLHLITYSISCYTHTHTHTHTQPFNSPLSGTTQVSLYQKGKTNLDFTEARDSEWQWHQLGHICKSAARSRQITMPAPHHSVFTGRMPFLPPNQHCQSTEGYLVKCNLKPTYKYLGNCNWMPSS